MIEKPIGLVLASILFVSCQCQPRSAFKKESEMNAQMKITSVAFGPGADIPKRYTCDGEDVSPPLAWTGVPANTKSLALICDDPDAPMGTWVHWVLFNLPASAKGLPEAVPAKPAIDKGGQQGINDFRKTGYGGPCPPSGTHRYFFKLYALDSEPNLGPSTTKQQLLKAIEGHVLAEAQVMGKYRR